MNAVQMDLADQYAKLVQDGKTYRYFCTDCNEPRAALCSGRCSMCGGARIIRNKPS
jgi:rRNA maturation endonuclease Nob1